MNTRIDERRMEHKWYYTAKAVRQWLRITGREDDDGGSNWGDAEQELCAMSHEAAVVDLAPSGAEVYRTKATVRGKRKRVEMTVVTEPRPEGPLPQLVSIRSH
jgi:hypothetical protein